MATILTDGNKTAEIIMRTWSDFQWSPDFSNDFFEVGGLKKVDVFGELAHEVDDLDYCIAQAHDWEFKRGDFCDDGEPDVDDRQVWIHFID
jgi:hypothetical protein